MKVNKILSEKPGIRASDIMSGKAGISSPEVRNLQKLLAEYANIR